MNTVAFAPDGQRLASGAKDGTVRIWDVKSGSELVCLEGHAGPVNSVTFAPDGILASASMDKTVRTWDVTSGTELLCLRGHEGPVLSVAFAPDGRRLASTSVDRTVIVWDVSNIVPRSPPGLIRMAPKIPPTQSDTDWVYRLHLRGHEGPVVNVVFAPDGRQLASASEDNTIRFWDSTQGTQLLWYLFTAP